MKQTITRICQLAIAVVIGALAMTVYMQHRELTAIRQQQLAASPKHQQELWDPKDGWKTMAGPSPTGTPIPFSAFVLHPTPR
jgi:hypothetical protein